MTQLADPADPADLATLPQPPAVRMPFRQLMHTMRDFHTAGEIFRDSAGPVAMTHLGPFTPPVVWVASPQGAHDVLADHDGAVDKTNTSAVQARLLAGDSVFSLPNDPWRPRRRLLQPLFTKHHVELFTGHMAAASRQVADAWRDGQVVDIDAEARRLTLRVLGRSLFGLDLDEQAERLAAPAKVLLSYTSDRMMSPVRLPLWLPTPQQQRWRRARGIIDDLLDGAIASARTRPGSAELLDLLLAATDPETGRRLTHDEVRSELTTFLLAGHDTTATTLSYSLWQLGRRPALQAAVREEATDLGRQPTLADIRRLPLATRVVHESLRLCPPAAAVGRLVERDLSVDGYRVAAGSEVLVAIWALHRDPAIWGADVLEYEPDRFLPERSRGRSRWAYLPFGGGVRSCLGDHFALTEAVVALATLVREVELVSLDDVFDVAVPFTLTAARPVPVRVRRREPVP